MGKGSLLSINGELLWLLKMIKLIAMTAFVCNIKMVLTTVCV